MNVPTATCHLLQFTGWPVCVGAGGPVSPGPAEVEAELVVVADGGGVIVVSLVATQYWYPWVVSQC